MFDSQEMGCDANPQISFKGAAYASYCKVRGFKFSEYQTGHGKMFIRYITILFELLSRIKVIFHP
jgi:hypothetical protein